MLQTVKNNIQQIIDCMAMKDWQKAQDILNEVAVTLQNLFDHALQDNDLTEINKHQLLLNYLQSKINNQNLH